MSPRWLSERLERSPLPAYAAAGAAGAPLMLCSCCVAPIFTAVYERSRQLGSALAVMLAAPSLNPAALALTFMFFAPGIAWIRLALALVAVFVGALFAARLVRTPAAVFTPRFNADVDQGEPEGEMDVNQTGSSRSSADDEIHNYPAQQDSRVTSFVNVWAASLSPSTIVRYGNSWSPSSCTVIRARIASAAA